MMLQMDKTYIDVYGHAELDPAHRVDSGGAQGPSAVCAGLRQLPRNPCQNLILPFLEWFMSCFRSLGVIFIF